MQVNRKRQCVFIDNWWLNSDVNASIAIAQLELDLATAAFADRQVA